MNKSKFKIVGTNTISYPQIRNFATLPFTSYTVKKKQDFIKLPAYFYFWAKKKTHPFLINLYFDLGLNKVDIYHFFNTVNIGNQPWITTFEHYLPRGAHRPGMHKNEEKYINYVINRLTHYSCKKLIAISKHAYKSQINYMYEYGLKVEDVVEKMTVMHPQQKKLLHSIENKKKSDDTIVFTIVGSAFFLKGGREILNVFSRLFEERAPVKLNIVSNLMYGDYASNTTVDDYKWALGVIKKYPQISHFSCLSNQKVLDLLLKSDIGLLPSYDETYGYSVLEAQAAGCPVITTNGAALPEINNNEVGWLIEVPLVEDNRSVPRSNEAKMIFSQIVEERLYAIVTEVIDNKSMIKEKGTKSLDRIEREHSPISRASIIESIYETALM